MNLTSAIFVLLSLGTVGVALAANPSFHEISFATADSGRIVANLYGNGDHAAVLAHGAVFDKESWHEQAEHLAKAGFAVLSIDFRGYGNSTAGKDGDALHEDILGAINHLYKEGAEKVSVVGGSMGGGAAARAATKAGEGKIHRLILLAHAPIANPEAIVAGSRLFVISRGDGLLDRVEAQYEKALEPKHLATLEGNAHAQHIFNSPHANELTQLITDFLSK